MATRALRVPPRYHAVHEAGHAVIAWVQTRSLGELEPGFSRIMLRSREEALAKFAGKVGGVFDVAGYQSFGEYMPTSGASSSQVDKLRDQMARAVISLLAGPATEARY